MIEFKKGQNWTIIDKIHCVTPRRIKSTTVQEENNLEWVTSIRKAIDYMEAHLEYDISAQDVANQVFMSSFFFQKGFSLMTGYGLSEYMRNRRLY